MNQKIPKTHKLKSILSTLMLINAQRRAELVYILNQDTKNAGSYIGKLVKSGYLNPKDKEYHLSKKARQYLNTINFEVVYNKNRGNAHPVHNLALAKTIFSILLNSNHDDILSIIKEKTTGLLLTPDITVKTKLINFMIEIDTGTQGLKVVQSKIDRYKMTVLQDPNNRLIFFTKSKNTYNNFKDIYQEIEFIYLDDINFNYNLNISVTNHLNKGQQNQKEKTNIQNNKMHDQLRTMFDT